MKLRCCILLSKPFPNTAILFDVSSLPLIPKLYFLRCKSSDTPESHSHLKSHHSSNLSFIFLPLVFPSPATLVFSKVGMAVVKVRCGLEVEGVFFLSLSPCPLTLHIYTDGLDGSHPHPVVSLAVVATPLHPLDALDSQRLIVDRCFLELV